MKEEFNTFRKIEYITLKLPSQDLHFSFNMKNSEHISYIGDLVNKTFYKTISGKVVHPLNIEGAELEVNLPAKDGFYFKPIFSYKVWPQFIKNYEYEFPIGPNKPGTKLEIYKKELDFKEYLKNTKGTKIEKYLNIEIELKDIKIKILYLGRTIYGKNYLVKSRLGHFYARSTVERDFLIKCNISDSVNFIDIPKPIIYNYEGKYRRYFPDFLINNTYIVEIKHQNQILSDPIIVAKTAESEKIYSKNNLKFKLLKPSQFENFFTEL